MVRRQLIPQELVTLTKENGSFDEERLGGSQFVGLIGQHGWDQ